MRAEGGVGAAGAGRRGGEVTVGTEAGSGAALNLLAASRGASESASNCILNLLIMLCEYKERRSKTEEGRCSALSAMFLYIVSQQ